MNVESSTNGAPPTPAVPMSDEEVWGVPTGPGDNLSADERLDMEAKMEELRMTPGYMDGTLKRNYPKRFEQITREIGQLTEQNQTADDQLTPLERSMKTGLDEQAIRQQNLVTQAIVLMDRMEMQGFARSEIPKDLTDFEFGGLLTQSLLAEGRYAEAENLIAQGLRRVPRNSRALELWQGYRDANDEDRQDTAEKLVLEIVSDLQKQHRLTRNCKGGKR